MAHTLRRRLWRVNGVLGIGVLVIWGWALLGGADPKPPLQLTERSSAVTAEPLGPDIPWQEVVARGRVFHGWGEGQAPAPRAEVVVHDGRLPLAAYKLMLWAHDSQGPDSIALKSKDPAHPGLFLPKEGRADRGVAIEGIERRGRCVFITVSRGEERFTYRVVDRNVLTPADRRIVRIVPTRSPEGDRTRLAFNAPPPGRVDVKVLPFLGRDGQVAGARVTGVRPGSGFARAGLRAGDVIVGVDGETWSTVERCRARLSDEAGATSLRIRGGDGENLRCLDIDS